jgi:hypothetical protein
LQLSNNIRWFPTRFNDVRQDYLNNTDFSVTKTFRVTERVSAQLRGESFNLTNRPVFGGPETSPTNQNFGPIRHLNGRGPIMGGCKIEICMPKFWGFENRGG